MSSGPAPSGSVELAGAAHSAEDEPGNGTASPVAVGAADGDSDRSRRESAIPPEPPSAIAGLDVAAIEAAFEREAPILLAAARAMILDDAEAQDLLQATFELAIRHAAALRDRTSLRGWLLAIQTREALRLRRRFRRLVRLDPGLLAIPVDDPDAGDSVAVRDALRRLSPRVRAAVVLHHMVGLSIRETAAALGTSENTVKSQLKAGLSRLREALGDG